MPQSTQLNEDELVEVARKLSQLLAKLSEELGTRIKFAFIGGAACSLLRVSNKSGFRGTSDLDLIVEVKAGCNAEIVSNWLLNEGSVGFVTQHGMMTPAIPIRDGKFLVEVEIFDVQVWPGRPQYDIANEASNPIMELKLSDLSPESMEEGKIPVMPPWWLLREKMLSQHERQGTPKAMTDILDIEVLVRLADEKSLVLSTKSMEHIVALQALIQKIPDDLKKELKKVIVCPSVFGN